MSSPLNHNANITLRRPRNGNSNLVLSRRLDNIRRRTTNNTSFVRTVPRNTRRKTRVVGVHRRVDALRQCSLVLLIDPVLAHIVARVRYIKGISRVACGSCWRGSDEGAVDRCVQGAPFVERRPGSVHGGGFALWAGKGNARGEQGEREKFEDPLHGSELNRMCFFWNKLAHGDGSMFIYPCSTRVRCDFPNSARD